MIDVVRSGPQRLARLQRTLMLIWRSSPPLALATLCVMVAQVGLPLLLLYVIKLVFDEFALALAQPVTAQAVRQVTVPILLAGGVTLLQSIASTAARVVGE